MKKIRTARGRTIDMAAMAKANENERAVGNVAMNAKGDRLDRKGKVIATVQNVARTAQKMKAAPKTVAVSDPKPIEEDVNIETPEGEDFDDILEEVSRTKKTREDETEYWEIEYSDGSMETIEITNEE